MVHWLCPGRPALRHCHWTAATLHGNGTLVTETHPAPTCTLGPAPRVPAAQDLADQLPSISNLLNGIKLPTIPLVRCVGPLCVATACANLRDQRRLPCGSAQTAGWHNLGQAAAGAC